MKFAAALILASLAVPALATSYDPLAGYSTVNNPNGAYTYGYTNTLGGALTDFTTGGTANGNIGSWTSPSVNQYLGVYSRPDAILIHPGPGGEYSVLRVTLAQAGSYHVSGTYSFDQTTTTDVHVLTNNVSQFDDVITGSGSTKAFDFTQYFAAGSTVDFAVGYGSNGDYYGDSTLLNASIAAVPEPATWALALVGFAMVGASVRRRRSVAINA